ncbi:DUF1631 domain-containing protein [Diaphorobacter sp. HDW4B]|uniref:DUF1631 family protein n=1 Tax=Diaphorobacter sp. HDW4B TaxID=2714925 RepID=UPI00140C9D9C|nr:DUF1631 family protein [Diaphorobacter sp. HDW4B]QIL69624.1 DUF1631 domain-containing protein [Diaphorobacter sp. HDW4B]
MPPQPDSFTKALEDCIQESVKTSSTLLTQVLVIGRRSMVEARLNASSPNQMLALHNATHMLVKYENELIATYPAELQKQFDAIRADTAGTIVRRTEVPFNKLTILQDHEFSAQMALSQLRHNVITATEVDCALLNSYTSAARGLMRVRPDSNPFQPESYILALQQVFETAGVDFQARQMWFQHMGTALGNELVLLYKALISRLTAQGVEPINYSLTRPKEYTVPDAAIEEAAYLIVPTAAPLATPVHTYAPAVFSGFSVLHSFKESDFAFPSLPSSNPSEPTLSFPSLETDPDPAAPADAASPFALTKEVSSGGMNSLIQSAEFVTGLTNALPTSDEDLAAMRARPEFEFLPPKSAEQESEKKEAAAAVKPEETTAASTSAADQPVSSTTAIQQLLEQILREQALPEAFSPIVRSFEPALVRLARRDDSFLTDEKHAARRLLSAVVQTGLNARSESTRQFDRFIALADDTARNLVALPVRDATAFEHMVLTWDRAWNKAAAGLIARSAAGHADAFQALVRAHSLAFAALPTAQQAPDHWRDFLTGPWARVTAHMQCASDSQRANKYLTIAPVLLWCVQPKIDVDDALRLRPWIESIRRHVHHGLASIGYSTAEIAPLLQRVDRLQIALDSGTAPDSAPPAANDETNHAKPTEPSHVDSFVQTLASGQWFDMWIKQRCIRTQLTWVNEGRTSFMFVAADRTSQSLTRRMLEGLVGKGGLRRVDGPGAERGAS